MQLIIAVTLTLMCFAAIITNAQPTTTTTQPPPDYSNCANVIPIPGNSGGATAQACSACNLGAQVYWPCDAQGLCYCQGSPIPPQYWLPFTFCSKVVPIANNPHGVTNCSMCDNGAQRYYPCDRPLVLCTCAPGFGNITIVATTTTAAAPPTSSPPTTTTTTKAPTSTPAPITAAPTTTKAPTSTPAPTPIPTTTKAPTTPAPTPVPTTTKAPTTTTPVPATLTPASAAATWIPPTIGDDIASFRTIDAPDCRGLFGGCLYTNALCASQLFYLAQSGNRPANGLDWRGTCFSSDGKNNAPSGMNLTLGWFDAGDFIKVNVPMAYSAAILALGVLEFPSAFTASSTNQRAIRDSMRYNLRVVAFHFLESWDPVSKKLAVAVGNGNDDHSSWAPCKVRGNGATRPVDFVSSSCPGTEVAADMVSALALTALALQILDPTSSSSSSLHKKLALAAAQIFDMMQQSRKQDYTICAPLAKPFYPSYSGYADEVAFAASSMARLVATSQSLLTGTAFAPTTTSYTKQYYLNLATGSYYTPTVGLSWDNKMIAATVNLFDVTGTASYATALRNAALASARSTSKTEGGLLKVDRWGSLRHAANAAFIAKVAATKAGVFTGTSVTAGRNAANTFAKKQLDYILGDNPARRSYVCGVGSNPPRNAHHRAAHDSPDAQISNPKYNKWPLTGALVGGPFDSDFSFQDDRSDYVTSEVATDYNAAFTGLLAAFAVTDESSSCALAGGSPTPTFPPPAPTPAPAPTPPPPPAPPGVQASVTVVMLSAWWLQIKVSPVLPATYKLQVVFNSNSASCILDRRTDWGTTAPIHYTCGPATQVDDGGQIVLRIYSSAQATAPYQNVVLKEGTLSVAMQLQAPEQFSAPVFVVKVADVLEIADSTRINVTQEPTVENAATVAFEVKPQPLIFYSGQAAHFEQEASVVALELRSNNGTLVNDTTFLGRSLNRTMQTTTFIAERLQQQVSAATYSNNGTAAPSAQNFLLAELGAVRINTVSIPAAPPAYIPSNIVVDEATTTSGPSATSSNTSNGDKSSAADDSGASPSTTIIVIAAGASAGFILVVVAALLIRNQRRSSARRAQLAHELDANADNLDEMRGNNSNNTRHKDFQQFNLSNQVEL